MKRFSQLMPAGVPVEFDYPARSFTLLSCITPVDVRFGTGSQTQEVAEGMTPGLWYEAETPFRKVVITSPTDQIVSFLVSMGRSGWALPPPSVQTFEVSLNGLAGGASTATETVDLGDDWASAIMTLQCDSMVAGAGGYMAMNCSMNPNMAGSRLGVGQSYQGIAFTAVSGSNHHLSSLRATGRYVKASLTNGANAQAGNARMMMHVMRNMTA